MKEAASSAHSRCCYFRGTGSEADGVTVRDGGAKCQVCGPCLLVLRLSMSLLETSYFRTAVSPYGEGCYFATAPQLPESLPCVRGTFQSCAAASISRLIRIYNSLSKSKAVDGKVSESFIESLRLQS